MIQQTAILDALATSVFLLDARLEVCYLNESAEALIHESINRVQGQPISAVLVPVAAPGGLDGKGLGLGKAVKDGTHADEGSAGLRRRATENVVEQACIKALRENLQIWLHDVEVDTPRSRSRNRVDCYCSAIEVDGETFVILEVGLQENHRNNGGGIGLARSNQAVIRGIAHEIRNPLGGIRGAAQLLEHEIDEAARQYTDIIIREADRLSRLVGQMQASVTRVERSSLNIHRVLEYVRSLVETQSPGIGRIATDYDPSLPRIDGDSDQLTQCFLNVMKNAAEAACATERQGRILVRSRIDARVVPEVNRKLQLVRIDIEDNGPGIDPDIIDHVFEPMVTSKPSGTGLGLSITAEIIRHHGGLITVDSEPGLTRFSVYLKTAADAFNGESYNDE